MTPLAVLAQRALLAGALRPVSSSDFAAELDPAELPLLARTLGAELTVKPEGMERWPRLDRYGRALARIADLALDRKRLAEGPPTGLYAASLDSCTESNAAFDRGLIDKGPRLASPMLFPYTLPGATASEAAMQFQLTGPYMVFPGGPATALAAALAATDALLTGAAARLLVASADVLGPATLRGLREAGRFDRPELPPVAEGAAALWLGRASDDAPGPRCVIDGALGPAGGGARAFGAMIEEALERGGVEPRAIVRTVSATVDPALRSAELAALAAVLGTHGAARCLHIAATCGDAGASLGLFALLSALEEETPALVLAADQAGSIAMVAAR